MHRPLDQNVNWMSSVQGKSPPVQVKEPYGYLEGFHPATRGVQSTPADNTRKRVWQYIEKERKHKSVRVLISDSELDCPSQAFNYFFPFMLLSMWLLILQ